MIAALLAALAVTAPPPDGTFDYQLGGAYPPADGVEVVVRDRTDRPAPGLYNVCYVNAFQAQPGERVRVALRDARGRLVVDRGWDEPLLDTSTARRRRALARIVGRWIDGCARDGFDAIEPDNLDSWRRSRGLLDRADNLAFARLLIRRAHARGLAIAQKNTPELGRRGRELGFDFAIAEECHAYAECARYIDVYGDRVYAIEYADHGGRAGFRSACARHGDRIAIAYRDRDVVPRGRRGHVFAHC